MPNGWGPDISSADLSVPAWAHVRLVQCFNRRERFLNLAVPPGEEPLRELPGALFRMTWLSGVDLAENWIETLPSDIWKLEALETLKLSRNPISRIPDVVGELRQLSVLNAEDCRIDELPPSLTRLQRLTKLRIGSNPLSSLPDWLGDCVSLKQLSMSYTWPLQLESLPDWLMRLAKLTALDVSGHGLTSLPAWIASLQRLEKLELRDNRFSEFPEASLNLSNLRIISLANSEQANWRGQLAVLNRNHVESLPGEITRLRHLTDCDLRGNPLQSPPIEVLYPSEEPSPNGQRIRRYFAQLKRTGQVELAEAKLLILGEPGAGKTTLSRKLLDSACRLRDESSTEGISISILRDNQRKTTPLRLNIWDFGGQEIYHATHQFFLTRRSIYALVADARQEDTDFFYWLNVISLLSDASPVLIVLNEKQNRVRDVDIGTLRAQFENIRHVARVNLATNRGLQELRAHVLTELSTLPHVKEALPRSWVSVRAALESEERPWILTEEFDALCRDNGFLDADEKRQLISFLHDIGVVVHYANDPLLKRIVILRPEWGTAAVYAVLDDPRTRESHGRFSRKDLGRFWGDPQYADMHDELLRLMMNFGLCYEVPRSKNQFIAPQLMPVDPPEYEKLPEGGLHVTVRYEFMPKGLLAQLIVKLHDLIRGSDVWRHGVVVQRDGSSAEVRELRHRSEITVRCHGPASRELYGMIDRTLQEIHTGYPHLSVRSFVPCPCETCARADRPELYDIGMLRRYLHDRRDSIECRASYARVEIRDLVLGLSPSRPEATTGGIVVTGESSTVIVAHKVDVSPSASTGGAHHMPQGPDNSAWQNGSFYLSAVLVLLAISAVITKSLTWAQALLAFVFVFVLIVTVGALQLRNDRRLSDKGFVQLMGIALRRVIPSRWTDKRGEE